MCSLDMVSNTFIKNLTSNKLGCYLEGRYLSYHNLTYPNQKWPSLSISSYGFRHLILPLRINIENLTSKSNRRLILSMHVFRTFIFRDLLQQVQKISIPATEVSTLFSFSCSSTLQAAKVQIHFSSSSSSISKTRNLLEEGPQRDLDCCKLENLARVKLAINDN